MLPMYAIGFHSHLLVTVHDSLNLSKFQFPLREVVTALLPCNFCGCEG